MKPLYSIHCFILLLILIFSEYPGKALAQADSIADEYLKDFEAFKKSNQDEFERFRRTNDSIFITFLKESWKSFDAFQSGMPLAPKPKIQPELRNYFLKEFKIEPLPSKIQGNPMQQPGLQPTMPPAIPGMPLITLDFYEVHIDLLKGSESFQTPDMVSQEYFVEFFEKARQSAIIDYNAKLLFSEAGRLGLNDWGLVQLIMKAAGEFFPMENEQVLFTWFVMLRNGYDVKTGYNQDHIYLLVPSRQVLYKTPCVQVNNKDYFVLKFNDQPVEIKKINTYEADYPSNEIKFSLLSEKLPSFPPKPLKKIISSHDSMEVILNQNLLDYFASFPECELAVQFSTPLSDLASSSILSALRDKIRGKSEQEITAYFLKFIQDGFPYKNDEDQFGHEKFMFAEQALFYPYTDCDDRSVLLARLLERFVRIKVVGLQYADHVAIAVNFQDPVKGGAYIELDNNKYYFCDPTFIGAEPGMIPEEYINAKPIIIFSNN